MMALLAGESHPLVPQDTGHVCAAPPRVSIISNGFLPRVDSRRCHFDDCDRRQCAQHSAFRATHTHTVVAMEEWTALMVLVLTMGAWYVGWIVERVSLQRCASDVACECIRTLPAAVREAAAALKSQTKPPQTGPGRDPRPNPGDE